MKQINPNHPAITEGGKYKLLGDNDIIQVRDETVCQSTLLSPAGDKWVSVDGFSEIGWTVGKYKESSVDADREERLFRREIRTIVELDLVYHIGESIDLSK